MEERGATAVRNDALNIKNREFQYSSQLGSILQSVPKKTPNQLFGAMDDEVWFWLNTEGYRKSAALREFLPGMPEERVQLQANGSSGDMVLRAALDIYVLFKRIFEENVGKFSACNM